MEWNRQSASNLVHISAQSRKRRIYKSVIRRFGEFGMKSRVDAFVRTGSRSAYCINRIDIFRQGQKIVVFAPCLVGPELLRVLRAAADKRKIDVRTNSRVTRINTDGAGAVTGVQVLERVNARYQIEARVVVVAAGGFSSNKEMVAKYCPKCVGMASSNQPGATGEGMLLAEEAGAGRQHQYPRDGGESRGRSDHGQSRSQTLRR
jgi:choline dehydrogenase-like flavoprotein